VAKEVGIPDPESLAERLSVTHVAERQLGSLAHVHNLLREALPNLKGHEHHKRVRRWLRGLPLHERFDLAWSLLVDPSSKEAALKYVLEAIGFGREDAASRARALLLDLPTDLTILIHGLRAETLRDELNKYAPKDWLEDVIIRRSEAPSDLAERGDHSVHVLCRDQDPGDIQLLIRHRVMDPSRSIIVDVVPDEDVPLPERILTEADHAGVPWTRVPRNRVGEAMQALLQTNKSRRLRNAHIRTLQPHLSQVLWRSSAVYYAGKELPVEADALPDDAMPPGHPVGLFPAVLTPSRELCELMLSLTDET